MNSIIPIVLCFDKNMITPCKVCLYSLFFNAQESTTYDVYIISKQNELNDEDREGFNVLIDKYPNNRISFIEIKNFFEKGFEIRNITQTCYYRLIIPSIKNRINDLHNSNYTKVIYLDVDTIIQCDLVDLYNTVLKDNEWIAGVCETPLYNNSDVSYLKNIGCNPNTYINSGILLMELDKLHKNNFTEMSLTHQDRKYICQDQDIINIICNGHIKLLPLKYNYTTILYRLSNYNPEFTKLKEDEIKDSEKCIIHYTGEKPWNDLCLRDYIWWYYFMKSPFRNHKSYLKHNLKIREKLISSNSIKQQIKLIFKRLLQKIKL